jgi:inhibitor of KinA
MTQATTDMSDTRFSIEPLGDRAVLVRFGIEPTRNCFNRIHAFAEHLQRLAIPGVIESVPAYTTLAIYFDPLIIREPALRERLLEIKLPEDASLEISVGRDVVVPVCYDEEFGEDLAYVAQVHRLTIQEVVAIHTSASYFVHMIGFLPGFPYLGGLSDRIATPRKESPRIRVAAGSVGIAGNQTGVYPIDSPGGWQIIGRSPWEFFDPRSDRPCRIQAGDSVRFIAISREEFQRIKAERSDRKHA